MEFDDFPEAPEDYSAPITPDHYFLSAQKEIRDIYERDRESVYYLRQIQVMFEKKYYHWITSNAITGLFKIGFLKDVRIQKERGTSTRYFIHKANRYSQRKINNIENIIVEYSQDHITRSCGHRAEDLFCKALAMRGFMPVASKVRKYKEKLWEKTGHDLDFVFTRDGLEYGCEIKNTLGYIEKEELETKIEMCSFFGIKPLFIMRYSPKTYNKMINDNGGFALIFETQIYELSQVELVKKIKNILGLPVICSVAIPEGIIDRFEKWHNKYM
jgi:hypothetical protein